MIRELLLSISLVGLSAALASCTRGERSAVDVGLLSTDIHVSIAQHALVLPFIALDDYAYRKQAFALNKNGDNEHAIAGLKQFLKNSADPELPLVVDGLSVAVRTYGWNDADMRQKAVCPLLTHEWARSICDNPWAAIQQALPADRFRLVDLSRLQVGDPRGPAECRGDDKSRQPFPQKAGEATIVCTAMVYGGQDDKYHHAVVRIDGNLGALWTVWRYGQQGETVEAMTEREGKAIVALVRFSLGKTEDFSTLQSVMCRLRRPGSVDGPKGVDCGRAAPTSGNTNQ